MTIRELAPLIRDRKVSPVEVTRDMLARIERENPALNAYALVLAGQAIEEAQAAEREIADGKYRGPLHGVPVSVKDLFYTRGVRTAAGSKIMAGFVPDHDAAAVEWLRQAGAVLLGKTQMHELAYGITNNNPHYGATHNPWKLSAIPGGSSGGSGAAVAAGLCYAALGSDTGGSIRIPAAYCGITGLKPSYGRVSRYGVVPLGTTLDHVGPLARSAWDAAAVLQAIAVYDARDAHLSPQQLPDILGSIDRGVEGITVGIPENYFFDRLAPDVERAFQNACRVFKELRARMRPVKLPGIARATELSRMVLLYEAAQVHATALRDRPQDFGDDVRALLEKGASVSAEDYTAAQQERRPLMAEFAEIFRDVEVLLTPTTPITAPAIGQTSIEIGGAQEDARIASTRLVRALNFFGVPALSTPCGFDSEGLPIGLQIIGRLFDEGMVLRAAHAFESVTEWSHRMPPL